MEDGHMSEKLKEVGLNLMSHKYCEDHTNYIKSGVGYWIQEDEICGGAIDFDGDGLTDGKKDSCGGDSGFFRNKYKKDLGFDFKLEHTFFGEDEKLYFLKIYRWTINLCCEW